MKKHTETEHDSRMGKKQMNIKQKVLREDRDLRVGKKEGESFITSSSHL
jgi:hypothetical protein